jgi:vacuolar-type H+-ATPase subunit C/Vma6
VSDLITYGFVAGRVKCLESKYLSADDLERLLGAENLEEIRSVLADTFYSFLIETNLAEEKEVKQRLELFLFNHFKDLTFNLTDRRVYQALLSLFDLQNFKILFRERFFGFPALRLSPLSSYPLEEMRKIVSGEKKVQPFSSWVAEAEKIEPKQLLDSWLEKVCLLEKLKLVKSLKSEILKQWAKEEIKLLNLKTIWRFKYYQPSDFSEAESWLVLTSSQEKSYYLSLLDLSSEDFLLMVKKEVGSEVQDELDLENAFSVKFKEYFEKASLKLADPALIYFYLDRRVKEAELIEMAIFSRLRNWSREFSQKVMRSYV